MFQNTHIDPNYTGISERGEVGGGEWGGYLISQCSSFFRITCNRQKSAQKRKMNKGV